MNWELILAALGISLAIFGVQEFRINTYQKDIAELREAQDKATIKAQGEQQAIEDKWSKKFADQDQKNHDQLSALQSQLDFANSASVGLRSTIDSYAAKAKRTCPAPQRPDQPGGDPIGVLAHVLGVSDDLAGVYAETAERRRVTAADCEARYDAVANVKP